MVAQMATYGWPMAAVRGKVEWRCAEKENGGRFVLQVVPSPGMTLVWPAASLVTWPTLVSGGNI